MRDYGIVSPQFWIGATGKQLRGHMEAQVMGAYLMTCPHANMLGLYYLPLVYAAHETGLPMEGAIKGLRRLSEVGFCHYDEASEYVWIVEMAKWQIGEALAASDNRVKGVNREYAALGNNPFLHGFFQKYQTAFHMTTPRGLEGACEALASQEQEQEQEQITHHVVTNIGAAPENPATPPAPAVVVEQFALAPTDPLPGEEVFLRFPLNDGTAYHVTTAALEDWQRLYPGVDVAQQLRNLLGWCQANPTKRKTRRGFPAFVTNALSRKQDQAGRAPAYRESATDRRSRIDAALFGNEQQGYPADDYRNGLTIEQ